VLDGIVFGATGICSDQSNSKVATTGAWFSGACGLGQALTCSKIGNAYGHPAGEIDWTYNYIANRYGNASNAWAFWNCIGQCGATYKTATWY
jgi:hypothetical protein